jgi:hypothetical protein
VEVIHYGSFKVAINQPVEVTPQECRDALLAGKISIQGQRMDFKIGVSNYHQYYSEGGRTAAGDCFITTFTRNGVTYQKSYEETTIQVLITRVRGLKLDNTIRFPSGLVAPHGDGVVRDVNDGMLVWDTKVLRCQDRMSLMYQGRAKLHQARSTSHAKYDLEEAIILVAQNETKRYAGLVFFFNLDDFIGIYVCFVPDFRVQYLDSSRDKNSGTKVPATRGL